MKNKTIIIVLIILGIILAALIGFYFIKQNKLTINPPKDAAQENPSNVPANKTMESPTQNKVPEENQVKTGAGIEDNKQTSIDQSQSKLVTNDFEVVLPAGWQQTAPAIGASAMAVKINEQINDPAAQKINFKSYFAVSYDTLQGKSMSEYVQTVKSGLQQAISNAVFTKEQDMTINGRSAHAIEMELAQQGVNFKILMVIVKGQGDDVWVMSFNTTKSSWEEYKETFYSIVNGFSLKK
ncbi:MAG: hypothetical protein COU46_02585 [Candidatus Niyogibacteria bacterium CG10_big_fil_rev_8_21_14_0_10_42_19]|uniref:PsbP C-terminal domain-containing protein n=1 Tax=Candidatus Niyogibacteria bacterium CG10_big_fil_rev_8_21_14_0_10_42_19 TaxID=1974725 RepID=A0A2H0THE1_9BACT|nr:MAG: hypothetical protein COU46_02585 [Candidatus Niyogibacteria bacterium CG10_big_fil_rev_8_21_14_0_10_42_19]